MADSFVDAVNNKATGGNAIVPETMDLLKTFESFRPTSYYDLDNKAKRGTLTVGYGFTKNDIPEIREGYSMDKVTAERMLPDLVWRSQIGPVGRPAAQSKERSEPCSNLTRKDTRPHLHPAL